MVAGFAVSGSGLRNIVSRGRCGRSPRSRMNTSMKVTAADVLKNPKFPDQWPFSPRDFLRQDESNDGIFYDQARIVYHIDDNAIAALTKFYAENLPADCDLLDICSSWVSHLPDSWKGKRVAGLGMNAEELKENKRLTEYAVKDLNDDPTLPYEDNSFDVITNVVSVDYLTKPLEVFKEMNRVLRPGGKAIMSFSNRCFPTKAINIWLSTNDYEHIYIVGCYYHFAGGYDNLESVDITPKTAFGFTDPMYIVQAAKKV